jgi:cobalt/nickel transport system permease protein
MTDMRVLDGLASKDTFVHSRHPVAHVLVTISFIITVASFNKYMLVSMFPMLIYPIIICASGEIPLLFIFRRVLPILPFVVGVGIFNPIYDHHVYAIVAGVAISAGWISFLSIVLRCCLSVTAALLLISVVGINGLSAALRTLKVPRILVLQLELTLRYIQVLGEEAGRIALAYYLRAPGQQGIAVRQWGPLAGQWLLRTLKRADRVHKAMLCRGYKGDIMLSARKAFSLGELGYLLGWVSFFTVVRLIDITQVVGAFALGALG